MKKHVGVRSGGRGSGGRGSGGGGSGSEGGGLRRLSGGYEPRIEFIVKMQKKISGGLVGRSVRSGVVN